MINLYWKVIKKMKIKIKALYKIKTIKLWYNQKAIFIFIGIINSLKIEIKFNFKI
jgi:hypothetical protein